MTLPAEDRLAIADLVTAYATALDTGQFPALAPLFAPGAVLDYSVFDGPVGGVDEAVAWLEESLAGFDTVRHHVSNHVVAAEGEGAARGSCYLLNPMGRGDSLMLVGGRYEDRYVRGDDGVWRFSSRTALLDWFRGL